MSTNGYERVREIGRIVDRYDSEPLGDRLLYLEDVPDDVCPRREAVSGACIFWVLVFAVVWAVFGLLVLGWK